MASNDQIISTILKHDRKVNSYKIALVRGINEVAMAFPDAADSGHDIAVPLRSLAQSWAAFYWPFMDSAAPIYQGQRASDPRDGHIRNDMAFRPQLTELRRLWEETIGGFKRASEGHFVVNELRMPRKRKSYPMALLSAYDRALKKIASGIEMPIRYAGPGEWTVFSKPNYLKELGPNVKPLPGTLRSDKCLVIENELWRAFAGLSMWVEALCIHEWSLFTERVQGDVAINRGAVYTLLTDHPDSRRPLTWERNRIDLLLMEGATFLCPWTKREIREGVAYDLDHLLPISVYPTNELWNLLPSDPAFNSHRKRDRLPTADRLIQAVPHFTSGYALYGQQAELAQALKEDAGIRFSAIDEQPDLFAGSLAGAVSNFLLQVAESRNLARF